MKDFLMRHKRLNLWFAAALGFIVLFYLLKESRQAANFLVDNITTPFKKGVASFFYLFPFSAAEVLTVLFFLLLLLLVCKGIWDLIRKEAKIHSLYQMVMSLLCTGLTVYAGICFLWGINYYADSFQDKSGLFARPSNKDELYETTKAFAEKASVYSTLVMRDENGVFAVPQDVFFENSVDAYANITEIYPFLAFQDRVPKKVCCSELMSHTNFTGFYFPFTGEANINYHAPDYLMPMTILHEMAHQRNVASENEANFVGILACITSDDPVFQYSGYISGYNQLSNALYREDYDAWMELRGLLSEEVLADLAYDGRYWAKYRNIVSEVSFEVYDNFLKGYGQESGIKSYGEVVDLLIAYYSGQPAAN